jgi:hypothetical protein
MPTGTCKYPAHHGPSAGQPIGLVVLIAIGAVIVIHWRTVVACLIVAVVLVVLASAVMMLWHRRYDLTPAPESVLELPDADRRVIVGPAAARAVAARTAALEAEIAALRARQIDAPAVHNHLHLHGVTTEDATAITAAANWQDNPQ